MSNYDPDDFITCEGTNGPQAPKRNERLYRRLKAIQDAVDAQSVLGAPYEVYEK